MSLGDYARAVEGAPDRGAPVIALIQGVGQIQRGDSDYGALDGWVMGADTIATALADAIDDPEVRAILFRINSPGGSAVASESIGRQVRRAAEKGKPVIVSMAEFAASGGYWIAMDAAQIVAEPGTLTGSIGVFAGKPVLTEFWDEVGVNWGQVARGANATMWSTLVGYSEQARAASRRSSTRPMPRLSRASPVAADCRATRCCGSRRGGSGPDSRPRTWGWSMSSVASIARSRWPKRR